MIRPHPSRSRGSALITVTMISLFVMLLAAGLVNHYAVSEARAVADSLARLRIYWAAMGHVNYALSRATREGLCGAATCVDDDNLTVTASTTDSRGDSLRGYLNELITTSSQRDWTFQTGYTLSIASSVEDDPVPNTDDGRLRIKITLQTVPSSVFDVFEALKGIAGRVRDLQIDLCLASCAGGSTPTSGDNKIEALRRVQL